MRTQHPGATLYELLITLALIGVLTTLSAPQLQNTMQILAVRAARESAFGMFTRGRALALEQGGAILEISARDDRVTIRSPSGSIQDELWLGEQRVDLLPDGGPDPVQLRYDAYGLGRMMSRTITLASGAARAGLTVSSFGRVRRW